MDQSTSSVAMPNDLKVQNRFQIMKAFRPGEPATVNDISGMTGISKQTVMKGVQFLIGKGLLVNAGKGASGNTGGKKPDLFALTNQKYFLCVTMWPRYVNLVLMNLREEVRYRSEGTTPASMDFETEVRFVREKIVRLLSDTNIAREAIQGVSFSVAGVIDYRGNILRYSSPAPPDWGTNIGFDDHFRDLFAPHTAIFVENVAKMTGRATLTDPAMLAREVFVLFTTWGFPACFISRGQIIAGKDSLVGEVGHMIVNPSDDELCGCGNRGCFERQLSLKRIGQMIAQGLMRHPGSALASAPDDDFLMDRVFEAAQGGDPLALEISEHAATVCSIMLRNVSVTFSPDIVVFQGPYGRADDRFRARLLECLKAFKYYGSGDPFDIWYDERSAYELDTAGSFYGLYTRYIHDYSLYADE